MKFWLNGVEKEIDVLPGEMLSDLLRTRLGMTGTKIGCGEAECGACTVLIDDAPILSCVYPAARAEGRKILTIEGLALDGNLHPLQEAFVQYGALQCGFCMPGQIMTAAALLKKNPNPGEKEIRAALKDTLCRCAGYPTIIQAVQAAARTMNTGEPIPPLGLEESEETHAVGHIQQRPDSLEKVTGTARFADDLQFPGMLVGRVLRAGVPHAILKRLDIKVAIDSTGVVAVLVAEDIPGERNHGLVIKDWPTLIGVGEKVRYIGDAVALVAAETLEDAEKALGLIEMEFDPLPVVADPVSAHEASAEKVHDGGNLLKHIKVRKGDVDIGFEGADIILEGIFHTPPNDHVFLEPECSIAVPSADGFMEIYVGSQIPYADREQVARSLSLPDENVRVIGTPIGGGFGGKEDIAGQIHAALLANACKRPVKILFDRHESLLVHPKRHATQIRVRIGAKQDGTLTAVETELFGDTGAYASLGEKVMTRATTHSTGPYNIPHVRADCFAMYTNNPPAGAFRGFGVTQSCFAVESLMDELAHTLEIDPVELRRKNALQVGHVTNTGQLLGESVGLLECIDRVEDELRRFSSQGSPFEPKIVSGHPNLRRAWGIAAAFKNTGLGGGAPDKASAEVELYPDGTAQVRTSSADMGQGLMTVLQLIAAEELTLPPDKVDVLLSDTGLTPDGGPTTASRQTYVTGNAVRHASVIVLQAVRSTLAEHFDVPPATIQFIEGLAQVDGKQIELAETIEIMKAAGQEPTALYEYWAPKTQPLGTGGNMHFAYSFAVQAAEAEVDLETGAVQILRVIAANDVGRAINPLGLRGQIEGGVMMGLGNALTEEFIVEEGYVFTDRMARYRIPSIVQAPEIIPIVVEHPTSEGPYGAKGVGEISSIPTTPAITNAINNACGIRVRTLPVDQDWLALELARAGGADRE
ncbi:MAG: molybdopterin cofactor-binding domain-containing protein [Anaerolineales bacterium]